MKKAKSQKVASNKKYYKEKQHEVGCLARYTGYVLSMLPRKDSLVNSSRETRVSTLNVYRVPEGKIDLCVIYFCHVRTTHISAAVGLKMKLMSFEDWTLSCRARPRKATIVCGWHIFVLRWWC